MKLYDNICYQEDVDYVANINLPWEKLQDKSIVISGATGLVGSFLVDVILLRNLKYGMNCKVYALGRNILKARERFGEVLNSQNFWFVPYDINQKLVMDNVVSAEYILHLASNTHPLAYATDPIGTIITNIIGTRNMLDYAYEHKSIRCAFASSNEIYGENRGDTEFFDEQYCGYIDCNSLRAGYPESKRCGEALCQAYILQKKLDVVIPRLTRSYGPTLLASDTKALSQFLKNAVAGNDIILKSNGTQFFSYLYVADSVSGLLTALLKGKKGEAYNIADESSDIALRDLAEMIAVYSGTKIVFEVPDDVEASGYSKATKARLDNKKIKSLGWSAKYDIETGITRTIDIMKDLRV